MGRVMTLLNNNFRHGMASGRIYGATTLSGMNPTVLRLKFNSGAMRRNIFAGEGITGSKTSLPNGNRHPVAYVMPRKNGGMSSRTASLTVTTVATGVNGLPGDGSATLTITTNTPDGQLVSTVQIGGAPASLSITTNTPLLTASSNGDGSASFSITFANATLGAEASVIGEALITINGTLTPYAIGIMQGTTEDQGLTVTGITNSVWNALLSNYSTTGSAGNTLSLAGSGGVDYATLAAAILAAAQASPIHSDIRKVNSYTVDGTGQTGSEWGPV
jgi:hypothetical protein